MGSGPELQGYHHLLREGLRSDFKSETTRNLEAWIWGFPPFAFRVENTEAARQGGKAELVNQQTLLATGVNWKCERISSGIFLSSVEGRKAICLKAGFGFYQLLKGGNGAKQTNWEQFGRVSHQSRTPFELATIFDQCRL